MPTSTGSILETVRNLKESLAKELPAEDDAATERCRDILDRLAECSMSLEILTETMIGVTVNKLKSHKELGETVKGLVKRWKKLAKPTAVKRRTSDKEPPPQARRESGGGNNSDSYNAELEWAGLSDHRTNICQKLYSIMTSHKAALVEQGVNETVVVQLAGSRTAEVERAMDEDAGRNRKAYTDKARSLCFNLKKNQKLAISVMLGHIEPAALVKFSAEELASDEARKKREEETKKLTDSRRLDWDTANEEKINKQCGISGDLLSASLFTCGRCKSIKTTSTQKQTRSADEPMTVFVFCLNCGKRWKC